MDSTSSADNISYSTCSLESAFSLSSEFIKPTARAECNFYDTEPIETSNLLLSTIQAEREFDKALNIKHKSIFRFNSTSTRKSNSEMTYQYQFEGLKNMPNENIFEEESLIESSDCKKLNKTDHFQSTLLLNKTGNIVETIDPTFKTCKNTIQLAKFESDNKSHSTVSKSKTIL